MTQPFPMGIATGDAFCNRSKERTHLASNIQHNRHTVLLAPRRYGKTSLVSQVISELKIPHCAMDFLLSASIESAKTKIIEKTGELLFQLLPKTQQAKEKILTIFKKMHPQIILSAAGQKIILQAPDHDATPEQTISDILINLDKTAVAAKKRAVVFMDEFQQIGQLDHQYTVEAAIRHAAERSQNISYIFSGSNRHLLLRMFSDKSRPFYKLCDTMRLERMSENDHTLFIQKQAKIKWKKELGSDVLKLIFTLSERHPYYLNLICNQAWANNYFPTTENMMLAWQHYIESEKTIFSSEISGLSNNQKLLLLALANHPTKQPFHNDYLKTTGLSVSSQKQAFNKLLALDFILQNESGIFCVLDPAMRDYIVLN